MTPLTQSTARAKTRLWWLGGRTGEARTAPACELGDNTRVQSLSWVNYSLPQWQSWGHPLNPRNIYKRLVFLIKAVNLISPINRLPVINQCLLGGSPTFSMITIMWIYSSISPILYLGLKVNLASEEASIHSPRSLLSGTLHIRTLLLCISIADLFRFVPVILFCFPLGHTFLLILLPLVSWFFLLAWYPVNFVPLYQCVELFAVSQCLDSPWKRRTSIKNRIHGVSGWLSWWSVRLLILGMWVRAPHGM